MIPEDMQRSLLKRAGYPTDADVRALTRHQRSLIAAHAARLRESLRPALYLGGATPTDF